MVGLLLAGCSLLAAPFKMESLSVGSTTFSNVTVLGANATDLFFTYNRGIMNVKLRYLDPDLQKRFDYDPDLAASIEKRQAAEDLVFRIAHAQLSRRAETIFCHQFNYKVAEREFEPLAINRASPWRGG